MPKVRNFRNFRPMVIFSEIADLEKVILWELSDLRSGMSVISDLRSVLSGIPDRRSEISKVSFFTEVSDPKVRSDISKVGNFRMSDLRSVLPKFPT